MYTLVSGAPEQFSRYVIPVTGVLNVFDASVNRIGVRYMACLGTLSPGPGVPNGKSGLGTTGNKWNSEERQYLQRLYYGPAVCIAGTNAYRLWTRQVDLSNVWLVSARNNLNLIVICYNLSRHLYQLARYTGVVTSVHFFLNNYFHVLGKSRNCFSLAFLKI